MITIKTLVVGLITVTTCMALSISGKVVDTSGTPINGATVRLEKNGQTAISGIDGIFLLGSPVSTINFSQSKPVSFSVHINNGLLYVNLIEKAKVEIVTCNLQGCIISTIRKTMNSGTNLIALHHTIAGIYLYKVKSGNTEIFLKSNSIGSKSYRTATLVQGSSSNIIAKQATTSSVINDVIAATRTGYLKNRVIVTNSDTSNIEIKMMLCADTVVDADGNVYQTVKIGNQVWTTENLRTTRYNDNTPISLWESQDTAVFCYYNNTTNSDSIEKYGALYSWYAINTGKLAPKGWHVPLDSELTILQNYLIHNGYNYDGTTDSNKIAKSMAAKADWDIYPAPGGISNDLTKNNRCGFSALPGGYRVRAPVVPPSSTFMWLGYSGRWWCATQTSNYNNAGCFELFAHASGSSNVSSEGKGYGLSIRCVKD